MPALGEIVAPEEKTCAPEPSWPPPLAGYAPLSVDGSFIELDGSSAAGMVLRDSVGSVILAAYRFIFTATILWRQKFMLSCKGWPWPRRF